MSAEFARRTILVRRIAGALAALVVLGVFQPSFAVAAAPKGPVISAAAGILIDGDSGRVLWEKDSGAKRPVASTTKIVTGLVVVERLRLTERVTMSARAEAIGAIDPLITELEVAAGESLTVEQLLYGLLLTSASDAAVALAEHVAGSEKAFAGLMNERARRAGATRTNFVNPHGFDHPDHYSSAADLVLVAMEAMRNPAFARIVATKEYDLQRPGRKTQRLVNRNELLGVFEGANGVKTGQTRASGKALVASASRKEEFRIAVVLGSPDPFAEATALLNYGFNGFRRFFAVREGRPWGTVTYGDGTTARLTAAGDLSVLVEAAGPDPASRYDDETSKLFFDPSGTGSVRLERVCMGECHSETTEPGLVAGLLWFFRPVLAYARG